MPDRVRQKSKWGAVRDKPTPGKRRCDACAKEHEVAGHTWLVLMPRQWTDEQRAELSRKKKAEWAKRKSAELTLWENVKRVIAKRLAN